MTICHLIYKELYRVTNASPSRLSQGWAATLPRIIMHLFARISCTWAMQPPSEAVLGSLACASFGVRCCSTSSQGIPVPSDARGMRPASTPMPTEMDRLSCAHPRAS